MRLTTSRFAKTVWMVAMAAVAVVILSPSPAAAETSYKRLKRKLRNLEWHTGETLKVVGEAAGIVAIEVLTNVHFTDDDSAEVNGDRHHSPPPPHEAEKPKPASVPHASVKETHPKP